MFKGVLIMIKELILLTLCITNIFTNALISSNLYERERYKLPINTFSKTAVIS